jgi:hypothetical protein
LHVLLARDHEDAARYIRTYPDLAEARVFTVTSPRPLEGLRVTAVSATSAARSHANYPFIYRTLSRSYALGRNGAPRVI